MIYSLKGRSRCCGRSQMRSLLIFTVLVLAVLVVVMFIQHREVLQLEDVLLPKELFQRRDVSPPTEVSKITEVIPHKEVLQPQEVMKDPCQAKSSSWVNLRPRNNFAYIMARFPYIDQRTIQTANYRNWDKCRHVSKLVGQIRCQPSHTKLLVTVMSHSASFRRREAIRKSWGNNVRTDGKYLVFFFLANVNDKGVMAKVKEEAMVYEDIVMGDFDEDFHKNSLKIEMMLEWSFKYCDFEYLLKTDDDSFISIPNLFKIIDSFGTNTTKVYMGRLHKYAAPTRNHPVYGVSENEYSGKYYPPFVSGGAVLFSYDVVRDLIPFFFPNPFKLEDVYTSLLAVNANITARHNPLFKHSDGDCSLADTTAVSLHFAKRYKKCVEDCMRELHITMLNNKANNKFVYSMYRKNKDIMDAARRNGSLFNKFQYHLDYRYFSNFNGSKLNKNIHAGKLLSKFQCNPYPLKVVVTLLSHAGNFKRREMVRKTWGKDVFSHGNNDFRVFFVVAKVEDNKVMSQLEKESEIYRDIIRGDFYESFYNNSWKLEMMFEWSWKYCDFEFLLKVDDDNFINMANLFDFIESLGTHPQGVYVGRAAQMGTIRAGRYSFTYDEYTSINIPPFVTGGAVLFSRDVVGGMIPHFHEHPIKLEDVYVAYLALNLGVNAQDSSLFQHSKGECKYNDAAISLHFWGRNAMTEVECMKHNFQNMLAKNSRMTFVDRHYKN